MTRNKFITLKTSGFIINLDKVDLIKFTYISGNTVQRTLFIGNTRVDLTSEEEDQIVDAIFGDLRR